MISFQIECDAISDENVMFQSENAKICIFLNTFFRKWFFQTETEQYLTDVADFKKN